MMRLSIFFAATFLFSTFAWSQAKSKKDFFPDTGVRHKMNTISGTIRELGPYIASEHEFVSEKNKNIVSQRLENLAELFKNLKSHQVISLQGLSINQGIMSEQLMQTVNLFKTDKKSLAHAKFTAALNLCVSCHTQSPGQNLSKLFQDKDINSMKISKFEKAELYFISRDYEKAMALYDDFLLKSKKSDDDELIYKALERELIYYIRIQKDFKLGKEAFQKFLKAKVLGDKMAKEVSEWVTTLDGKTLWDGFNPALVKEDEMEKFMKSFIADEEEGPIFTLTNSSEVYDLNLSTILLDYLNAHPETKLGGRILYWLAILDKRVNDELFFSVGDFYLVSCMERFSKDPVAKDCYEAYEEDIELNYTSKDKKELPVAIKDRLNGFKKLINYHE